MKKGSKHSEEAKKNMSKSHIGKNPWNKGKKLGPLTQEQKDKIGVSLKKAYDEGRRTISNEPSWLKGLTYEEAYGDRAEEIKEKLWDKRGRHPLNVPWKKEGDTEWIKYLKDGEIKYSRYYIYLMEKEIGHKIPKGYCVHHIDKDRMNNKMENLQLLTNLEHHMIHRDDIHWNRTGCVLVADI